MLRKLKDADSTLRNMVLINNFMTRLHWTVQNKSWAAVAELFWLQDDMFEEMEPFGASGTLQGSFQLLAAIGPWPSKWTKTEKN